MRWVVSGRELLSDHHATTFVPFGFVVCVSTLPRAIQYACEFGSVIAFLGIKAVGVEKNQRGFGLLERMQFVCVDAYWI
jgi:hypothetical protein